MRLLYFAEEWPSLFERFLCREIQWMRKRGHSVLLEIQSRTLHAVIEAIYQDAIAGRKQYWFVALAGKSNSVAVVPND
jgi:hypothetical protein